MRERERAAVRRWKKRSRSYCYTHIYHKAIMTSFVSASKKQGEREKKEEREGERQGELNHKAMDYKIISHGLCSLCRSTLRIYIRDAALPLCFIFTPCRCCSAASSQPVGRSSPTHSLFSLSHSLSLDMLLSLSPLEVGQEAGSASSNPSDKEKS